MNLLLAGMMFGKEDKMRNVPYFKLFPLILMVFVGQTFAEALTILAIGTGIAMALAGGASVISGLEGIKSQRIEGRKTRKHNLDLYKRQVGDEKAAAKKLLDFEKLKHKDAVAFKKFEQSQNTIWGMQDRLSENQVMQRNLINIGKNRGGSTLPNSTMGVS